MRADLRLDTLWLQAAGKSLQNLAPVRISWRDAALVVEDFRLAGDQYHLSVRGGGSIAAGWNLQAEGAVNLAVFKEYWPEIEDVDGRGDLRADPRGPWSAPLPEGSLTVHEAFVRARSLPEPLEHLEGRLELRGRTLTATGLSGTMSGGAFRGGGSYEFAQDRLDAQVEGRLDLALFRGAHPGGARAARAGRGAAAHGRAARGPRVLGGRRRSRRGDVPAAVSREDHASAGEGPRGGRAPGGPGAGRADRGRHRAPDRDDGLGPLAGPGGRRARRQGHPGLARRRPQGPERPAPRPARDFQDLKLAGEVRILKARYLREFSEHLPAARPGRRPGGRRRRRGPDLSRMALDVKVTAADNVWISNRMAKIETAVALDIGGRLGAPVVSGEITAIQGEAVYLSRQFRLESGSLRFVPPALVPLVDVQASTSVGDTQIYFLVDGPLNKLSYHLTSQPGCARKTLSRC